MGAWGTASFDNDDASDWVYELERRGVAAIDGALAEALRATDLEVPTDVNVIAAGEVIAASLGRPAASLPDDVLDLASGLSASITAEHARRARTAAERVLEASEVAELWAESDDDAEWRATIQDLIGRLAT
ncbi:MAG: DUF4259 domain-containing protein [Candidatus Limnocylindrales bacterium]